jgi:hypothetical protein
MGAAAVSQREDHRAEQRKELSEKETQGKYTASDHWDLGVATAQIFQELEMLADLVNLDESVTDARVLENGLRG